MNAVYYKDNRETQIYMIIEKNINIRLYYIENLLI